MKLFRKWYNNYRFIKKTSFAVMAMSLITISLFGFIEPANAQDILNKPVSMTLKGQKLKDAFDNLQKQTHIVFLYSDMDQLSLKISIDVKNKPLQKVLDQLLKPVGLEYELTGGKILISKNPARPTKKLIFQGKVVDLEHKPLPGVSVKIKGTDIAGLTNNYGQFKVSANTDNAVLVFSYVGFITKELQAKAGGEIDVIMEENPNSLDEVVVVGYGTEKRSDLTGAIGTLKGGNLQQTKAVSFLERMQGKVAGVQITSSSGEPGSAVNINIRGENSVNASSSPLYVIDGVQIEANSGEIASFSAVANPLSSINPADIESVDILKDASATAIYGARGANGVIIITTKSGKDGSTLELNSSWGISTASKELDLLNGQEYAQYRFSRSPNSEDWGETVDGKRQVKDFSNVPWHNWQEEVLRPALTQDYNLFYGSGTAKTKFSSSVGYYDQQGIVDNNDYKRYSLNLKIDHSVNRKFKIGTSVNGSYGIGTGAASSSGQTLNLFGVVQNLLMFKPIYLPGQDMDEFDPEDLSVSSPLNFVNDSYKKTPFSKVIVNTYGEYSILKSLVLRSSVGAVLTNSENDEFYPSTTAWGYTRNGLAIINTTNSNSWVQTNTLTYNKKFEGGHNINALLGFETNSYIYRSFDMRGEGFDLQSINGIDNINQAKILSQLPTTGKQKTNRISEFGRLNYNYKNKYYATATLRKDGSSKFGDSNKYAWFPSGALGWTVSNESFMENQKLVSNLKLRASYGVTGNDRIPPYQSLANGTIVYYSGGTTAEPGLAITSIANPNLKWETTYQYNAGLDLELLKGRVALTADIYKKETKDMLLNADIPGQSGFSKQWQNIGRVDNKGIELALTTNNISGKDFSWSTSFNITMNRNKVVSLGGTTSIPVVVSGHIANVGRVIEGQPLGTGYGFIFDGIYQNSDFVDPTSSTPVLKDGVVKRSGVSVKPGDFKFKDLDGDNIIDNINDATVISNSTPKHFGGLSNTFTYKNFDLSVLFQWSYGNQILNAGRYRYEGYQTSNLAKEFWEDMWTPDNPTNKTPALSAEGRYDASSYYVEDGSYLRLKNVALGYNLPSSVLRSLHLSNCRFYVAGDNLITWTNYSGFDPEVASNYSLLPGLDMVSYPRSRTFTFGLNVKF